MPSLLVFFQEATRRVSVSNGTDNDTSHTGLLNFRRPYIVWSMERNNVTESFVSPMMVGQASTSTKNIVIRDKNIAILVNGIGW